MERVLKLARVKSLILVVSILAVAQSALATTAIMPSDDEMIVASRAIVRGKVLSVEVGLDGQNLVFTYITLKVKEVLKGQITERRIVIKEPGGELGNRGSIVFGTPQFARGDRVLLYLDTWRDGSFRVHEMFLGRFSIVQEPGRDELTVTRNMPERGVSILGQSARGSITNSMELNAYTDMVRTRLAANLEQSREFETQAYGDTPMLAQPIEYKEPDGGDISPQFHLWNPPIRWFQPDSGQSVVFKTNPEGAPTPQSVADAAAAMGAWSTVPGCSLRVTDGGTTSGCGLFGLDGENTISFNNCDGYFSGTGTCSSGILAVASIASYDPSQTRVVNGVSFAKALESNITFNPFSACNFGDHCNVQEITTHEMGHALGLHHSWQSSFGGTPTPTEQIATMYWIAHFDGRCASLKTDDINGITFIYPSSGGGPGPLTIVTSALSGGTVGTVYSQSISASGGTLPYTWSLVSGLGTLPPGLSLSTGGVIAGTPTTAGTYNFTVRVTDNVAATAQKALSIVVAASGGGGALNSQFVSQSVPTSLQPGQGFSVNMKFLNTGTQTWSGTAFYFASQNPPLNQTWGGNGVSLFGFSAAPGEVLDVNFTATAPSIPGTYNFQWQMYENGGVGFFGQVSTNVVVNVGVQTNYQGSHDGAGCDTISGWAWDANNPGGTVNVDIYDGSNLIATVPANMYREDLLNAVSSPSHGFSYTTPAALKNGAGHIVNVKFSGTNTLLSNSARTVQCTLPSNFQGRHDGQGCNAIEGWAWNSNDPNGTVNVDIYDGTTLISTIAATLYRQDLADAFGSPYHGFIYHTPANLKDGQSHTITVKFGATSTTLTWNTPQAFTCGGATPSLHGNHDVANCNTISGYAWDSNDDLSTVNVAIFSDGNLLVVVPAQQAYPGIGNGYHGFVYAVPASLKNGVTHSITVKFSGTSTNLTGSPKAILCTGGP